LHISQKPKKPNYYSFNALMTKLFSKKITLTAMKISENILQYIWKYRLFRQSALRTVSGKKLKVIRLGRHNFDEGPDFENALLLIDDIEWVGNVEVHVNSSAWNDHQHQYNPFYNNVVLHVVYRYDREIKREDGTIPETLELQSIVNPEVLNNYHSMLNNMNWIPCEGSIHSVDPFHISKWLSTVLYERLISKSDNVNNLLTEFQGDWERVAFVLLARNFGFLVNSDAFERLARSFPHGLINKYRDKPTTIEALLFGQAGMLDELNIGEEYPHTLQQEYRYLQKAYSLKPIERANWKFLRMRPVSFPSFRLAQFATFCFTINHFFAKIIETENLNLWRIWFKSLKVNTYWSTHYHFNKETETHGTQLGQGAIDLILINTVAVLLFSYGKYMGNDTFIERSIHFLENIKPEDNRIIQQFKLIGIESKSAIDTQALKQLKTIYCANKRCLNCEIGLQIIKRSK